MPRAECFEKHLSGVLRVGLIGGIFHAEKPTDALLPGISEACLAKKVPSMFRALHTSHYAVLPSTAAMNVDKT
jgi:hypothetical protein